jgi:hypothetical protein
MVGPALDISRAATMQPRRPSERVDISIRLTEQNLVEQVLARVIYCYQATLLSSEAFLKFKRTKIIATYEHQVFFSDL